MSRSLSGYLALGLTILISGCGGRPGTTSLPVTPQAAATSLKTTATTATTATTTATPCLTSPIKGLQVTVTSLSLNATDTTATFTACTQYFSDYTITASNPGVVSFPSPVTPTEPANGTIYSASISVTELKVGTTNLTITDKKGNSASIAIMVAPGSPLNGPLHETTTGGYLPTDIATTLKFPVQQGYDGTGLTVAIVIDSDLNAADLQTYLSYNQTPIRPRTISTVSVDGGTGVNGDSVETTLDTETIAGLAPGANVTIYETPDLSDQHLNDAYNQIISDNKAKVVNMSYGGCEAFFQDLSNTAFAQGATQGIAWAAASGDHGNSCYGDAAGDVLTYTTVAASSPSSDPNVIAVGGNDSQLSGPGSPDELLNPAVGTLANHPGVKAGGGVSTVYTLPTYQQGLNGEASTTFRNVPDVSMPFFGAAQYQNGNWFQIGGTSWSAPQMAALMAEVYEYCGGSIPNPVNIPYNVYHANPATFLDVTNGNDQYATTTPFYSAAVGYDNASGLGVPFGMPFAQAACPNKQPSALLSSIAGRSLDSTLQHAAAPITIDVTPRVRGLSDIGRRPDVTMTTIQIGLLPTPAVASNERAVIAVLQGAGFTITQTFGDHLIVDAQAPSATVERFFTTQLHNVDEGAYGTRYLPVTPVTIPTSIAPYVAGVLLDNVVTKFTPHHMSQRR